MKNEKLTILDFKKEKLVNLNEEDMMKVKGGHTSWPCFKAAQEVIKGTLDIGKDTSWMGCDPKPSPPADDFYISSIQYPEVTCATVPPVVIEVY